MSGQSFQGFKAAQATARRFAENSVFFKYSRSRGCLSIFLLGIVRVDSCRRPVAFVWHGAGGFVRGFDEQQ